MIRYALVCADGHGFEAWFRDSEAFDEQNRDSLLDCPVCGSAKVRKALMAPALRRGAAAPPPADVAPQVPAVRETPAVVMDDERFRAIRSALRELHAKVVATSQNVGPAFPAEARKIHDGEAPARSIYGTATPDEVRSLVEDGVEVLPLPPMPDERN